MLDNSVAIFDLKQIKERDENEVRQGFVDKRMMNQDMSKPSPAIDGSAIFLPKQHSSHYKPELDSSIASSVNVDETIGLGKST